MKHVIALAQMNPLVGDIEANVTQILALTEQAQKHYGAGLVVFPELTLTGYPPEDLLLRDDLLQHVVVGLQRIAAALTDVCVVVGHPQRIGDKLYNAVSVVQSQRVIAVYQKQALPNYGVFDEVRYFHPGEDSCVFDFHGIPMGITLCEDIWEEAPMLKSVTDGARLVLNLNASPFHTNKHLKRLSVVRARIGQAGVPVVYVNQVGGQDELVFDGQSFVLDGEGKMVLQMPAFEQTIQAVAIEFKQPPYVHVKRCEFATSRPPNDTDAEAEIVYAALVMGVRDYVQKNGFQGAILGLSGGIDSALTLALAVDALGAKQVEAVMMPTRYTADMSLQDAQQEADWLGVNYRVLAIEKPFETFLDVLQPVFSGLSADATEENIQARCRGIILMAISNKTGKIVLTTGNKSEMAVGYATLYGDMAGGFAPLKDVSKLMVYRLSNYRNRISPAIPQRVIDRPPSAELAPDQKDTDSLPPYTTLDAIIEGYIEQDLSRDDIVGLGYDSDIVDDVLRLIDRNEYKRRQAPPGIKITARAFGRDRRYPITSGFAKHHQKTLIVKNRKLT